MYPLVYVRVHTCTTTYTRGYMHVRTTGYICVPTLSTYGEVDPFCAIILLNIEPFLLVYILALFYRDISMPQRTIFTPSPSRTLPMQITLTSMMFYTAYILFNMKQFLEIMVYSTISKRHQDDTIFTHLVDLGCVNTNIRSQIRSTRIFTPIYG